MRTENQKVEKGTGSDAGNAGRRIEHQRFSHVKYRKRDARAVYRFNTDYRRVFWNIAGLPGIR